MFLEEAYLENRWLYVSCMDFVAIMESTYIHPVYLPASTTLQAMTNDSRTSPDAQALQQSLRVLCTLLYLRETSVLPASADYAPQGRRMLDL